MRTQKCYCSTCRGKTVGINKYKRHRQAELANAHIRPFKNSTFSSSPSLLSPCMIKSTREGRYQQVVLDQILTVEPLLRQGANSLGQDNLCQFLHLPTSANGLSSQLPLDEIDLALIPKSSLALHEMAVSKSRRVMLRMMSEGKKSLAIYTEIMATAVSSLNSRLAAIQEKKVSDWEVIRLRESLSPDVRTIDTEPYLAVLQPSPGREKVFAQLIKTAVVNLLSHSSDADTSFVAEADIILEAEFGPQKSHGKARSAPTLDHAIKFLKLNPETEEFVCCSVCWALYPCVERNLDECPQFCTRVPDFGSQECGTVLRTWKASGQGKWQPNRRYIMQDVADWIARLYCREDLEKYLDQDEVYPTGEYLRHFMESPIARTLLDLDGKTPFIDGKGHCFVCLNQDGFGIFDEGVGGKSYKVGGLYLSCANLPPALQLRRENMCCISLTTGPVEPNGVQMISLLDPLVDRFLDLWYHGIFLSRTPKHRHGRHIRAALCFFIGDYPAFSLATGYPRHGHKQFCPECGLPYSDIDNTHMDCWCPRNWENDKRNALKWRDAKNRKERTTIEETTGQLWSPLWRLPYWKGAMMAPADRMHMFDLGLVPRHVRKVWGISRKIPDGDPLSHWSYNESQPEESLNIARSRIEAGEVTQISGLEDRILRVLCREYGLQYGGHRGQRRMVKQLKLHALRKMSPGGLTPDNENDILSETVDTDATNSTPAATGKRTKKDRWLTVPLLTRALAREYYFHRSKTNILAEMAQDVLVKFVQLIVPNHPSNIASWNCNKLISLVQEARKRDNIVDAQGRICFQRKKRAPTKTTATVILGPSMLDSIQSDIKQTSLPSSITQPPNGLGTAAGGSYTAAEWRTLATITLPITLLQKWGNKPANSVEYRRLQNFMHLVAAIRQTLRGRLTQRDISSYSAHIHQYLSGLLELYPGTSISPYQHRSGHFGETMRLYGPTSAYNTGSFEQLNGQMKKIPHNNHTGEIETTMFYKFAQAQNLRAVLESPKLPAVVTRMLGVYAAKFKFDISSALSRDPNSAYDEHFQPKARSAGSLRKQRPVFLDREDARMFLAFVRASYDIRTTATLIYPHNTITTPIGVLANSSSRSASSSRVLYRASDGTLRAGEICRIFSHIHMISAEPSSADIVRTFLKVQTYRNLTVEDSPIDPQKRFPDSGFRLFYKMFEAQPSFVELKDILSRLGVHPNFKTGATVEDGILTVDLSTV